MKISIRSILIAIVGVALIGILIQWIPYGHDHSNPPVIKEPNWNSPQTRAITKRACFDCHSNETVWPWYSNVAPVSWLINNDVTRGREHLNFSAWDVHPFLPQGQGEGIEHQHGSEIIQEVLESGDMPPATYLLLHPEARLTDEELRILIEGLPKSTRE